MLMERYALIIARVQNCPDTTKLVSHKDCHEVSHGVGHEVSYVVSHGVGQGVGNEVGHEVCLYMS